MPRTPGGPGGPSGPARPRPWAVVSAVVAPVAMIGGWSVAAAIQPRGFDAVRGTISELATGAVAHPGVMTAGLLVTGVAHVVTASGVPVRRASRVLLALGGAATAAVGLLPVDVAAKPHAVAAGLAFGALALWPAAAARRDGPAALRPLPATAASVVLLAALGWFVVELTSGGDRVGLAERVVAGAQALAPLLLVLALRGADRGRLRGGRAGTGSVRG